jgi:hypothetical protein
MEKPREVTLTQILRELMQRASIYVAVTLPHPMTIALMSRLNEMPHGPAELRNQQSLKRNK